MVIELLSESTEKVDRTDKMRVYAKLLRVPEYYLFDPFTGVLEAYALDLATMAYAPVAPGAGGDVSGSASCPAAVSSGRRLPGASRES